MKSFLHGKKSSLTMAAKPPSAGAAAPPLRAALGPAKDLGTLSAPNIEVVKEGDKVVRLLITCVCGERVEVECIYPVGT
jgi:hypothetical protein